MKFHRKSSRLNKGKVRWLMLLLWEVGKLHSGISPFGRLFGYNCLQAEILQKGKGSLKPQYSTSECFTFIFIIIIINKQGFTLGINLDTFTEIDPNFDWNGFLFISCNSPAFLNKVHLKISEGKNKMHQFISLTQGLLALSEGCLSCNLISV